MSRNNESDAYRPSYDDVSELVNEIFRDIALGSGPEEDSSATTPNTLGYLGAAGLTLYPWGADRLDPAA